MKKGLPIFILSLLSLIFNAANAEETASVPNDWMGIYLGGQLQYNWADTSWEFPFEEFYNAKTGSNSFSTDPHDTTVGAILGFNQQFTRFPIVIGAEGTYTGMNVSQTLTGAVSSLYPNDTFETKLDEVWTVTARAGYALQNWLFYGRGGYAAAHTTLKAVSGEPGAGVVGKEDKFQSGWTAGAGIEYMPLDMFVVGLQYDYIRLGEETFSTTTTGTSVGEPFVVNLQPVNLNVLSLRATFKFQ